MLRLWLGLGPVTLGLELGTVRVRLGITVGVTVAARLGVTVAVGVGLVPAVMLTRVPGEPVRAPG